MSFGVVALWGLVGLVVGGLVAVSCCPRVVLCGFLGQGCHDGGGLGGASIGVCMLGVALVLWGIVVAGLVVVGLLGVGLVVVGIAWYSWLAVCLVAVCRGAVGRWAVCLVAVGRWGLELALGRWAGRAGLGVDRLHRYVGSVWRGLLALCRWGSGLRVAIFAGLGLLALCR